MATPRVNTEQARKRHDGINKVCTNCDEPFYALGSGKKGQTWCGECIRIYMKEGKKQAIKLRRKPTPNIKEVSK